MSVLSVMRKNTGRKTARSCKLGTTAATIGDHKQSEATRLWHMRLGHAGGKSLQILVKQGLLKGAKGLQVRALQALCYGKADVWGPSIGSKTLFRLLMTFPEKFGVYDED